MSFHRARRFLSVALLALAFAGASIAAEKKAPKPVLKVVPNPSDTISLDVKDADIRDVLRVFSMLTKKNFAIDPEVKGSVTMRLEDVRWQDALDVMLRSNGFASEIDGGIVRVATPAKLAGEKH